MKTNRKDLFDKKKREVQVKAQTFISIYRIYKQEAQKAKVNNLSELHPYISNKKFYIIHDNPP